MVAHTPQGLESTLGDRLYDTAAGVFRWGFRHYDWRIEAAGAEHVPLEGPAILACNHIGYVDFAFAGLAQPHRRVRFMIRNEIMRKPVLGWALRRIGQIEVDQYGDPEEGMRAALAALRRGEIVGVFPEGTISPSFVPMQGKTGAVRLALSTGAPIVPTAVWGSQRVLTKGRERDVPHHIAILVRYGEAYHLEPDEHPREATADLMARISLLVKDAQESYPQRPRTPDDTWWVPAHLGGTAPTVEEAAERIAEQIEQRRRRALGGAG